MWNGNYVIATYPVITGKEVKLGNISGISNVSLSTKLFSKYLEILEWMPRLVSEKPPTCHISDTMCRTKNLIPKCKPQTITKFITIFSALTKNGMARKATTKHAWKKYTYKITPCVSTTAIGGAICYILLVMVPPKALAGSQGVILYFSRERYTFLKKVLSCHYRDTMCLINISTLCCILNLY